MKKNGEYDPPKYGSLKKTCRIMKATLLFLMLTVCHSFGMVYSQEVRLDIDLENATFGQFMEQVKDQSDFTFFFHDAMVMKLTNITLHVKQEDIDAILTKCLKGSGITYRIKDRTIILYGTDDNTKKEIEVKGRVVDEKGEPLPGATVKVKDEPGEKGVLRGTVTGPDGNFSLKVPNNKAVLEISFVGYVSQTIPVANAEALKKIVLKEVVENIDEVIVTGYQRIDRKLFTGAAAVIKAEVVKKYCHCINRTRRWRCSCFLMFITTLFYCIATGWCMMRMVRKTSCKNVSCTCGSPGDCKVLRGIWTGLCFRL